MAEWSQRTGIHPINHIVVVKEEIARAHPWVKAELLALFEAAKQKSPGNTAPPSGLQANRSDHHLEAHVAAAYLLERPPEPPFVALIASGGHTLLYEVAERGVYVRLGQTTDDAAGECFDKIAAMLGLPYPGGPSIEKAAAGGDPAAIDLPRPLKNRKNDDFSFSGLKTAVLYRLKGQDKRRYDPTESEFSVADFAASAQEAIADVLSFKAVRATANRGHTRLVLGGGVAANTRLRELATERAAAAGIDIFMPPRHLCTDNAAMVAVRGAELLAEGRRDGLDLDVDPYAE